MYYINSCGTAFSFTENITRKIYVKTNKDRDNVNLIYILDNDTRRFHVEDGLCIESFDSRKEADLFISWIADCFHFKLIPSTYEGFKKICKKYLDKV